MALVFWRRDHNATSYSTETNKPHITARADISRRDHNATSYSTETLDTLSASLGTHRQRS